MLQPLISPLTAPKTRNISITVHLNRIMLSYLSSTPLFHNIHFLASHCHVILTHHTLQHHRPAGSVSLYISTRCLDNEISPAIYNDDTTSSIDEDDVINTGDNLVNECFVHSVEDLIIPCSSFPPSPSALSLVHPDDSTLSLDFEGLQLHSPVNLGDDADAMGLGDVDARNISSPRLPPLLSLIPPDEVVDFSTPVQSTNNTDGVDGNTPSTSQDGVLDCIASSAATTHTNASSTINDALDPSAVENVHALQRRCRRLAKERDEARAEAFAEASVAVQRGIEIENLRTCVLYYSFCI